MKSNNHSFGALGRVLCCVCAIVLCMGCLSSGTYSWYNETAKASGTVQFGDWADAPVNLLSNGDFSNGLTGWAKKNASTNTIEVVDGYLKLQRSQTGSAPYVQQKIAGTYPAGTYTVSGKVLVSGEEGCAYAQLEVSFKNESGTVISAPTRYSFKGANLPEAMTWTDFSFDVVVEEGQTATELGIMLKHTERRVGYICYDDISVTAK